MCVYVSPFRIVKSEVGQRHPDGFRPSLFLFSLHQREASLHLNAAVAQLGAKDAFLACMVCVWACCARVPYICFQVAAEVKGSVRWTFIYFTPLSLEPDLGGKPGPTGSSSRSHTDTQRLAPSLADPPPVGHVPHNSSQLSG